MRDDIAVLVITGPVGAGKTTVAFAMAMLLERRDIPHVVVDMDALRNVYPTPPGDPFATRLGYLNLAAIWPNLRRMGPRVVLLADVVESRAQVAEYEAALSGTAVTVVRLHAPMHLVLERLARRESAATIDWYRRRAPELQEIMERGQVADVVIEVGERDADDVACEIARECGLIPD